MFSKKLFHKKATPPKKPAVWQDIRPAKPLTKIGKLKLKIKRLFFKPQKPVVKPLKKYKLHPTYIFMLTVLIASAFIIWKALLVPHKTTNTSTPTYTTANLETGTPNYQTVIPADKTIRELGGWTRVSPTGSDEVYAYVDKIDNISISVSEQLLPDSFKTGTAEQIAALAESFNATEKITVGEVIAYIGTSSEGPQSVIMTKNGLLILIKSTAKIGNDSWARYINSLK